MKAPRTNADRVAEFEAMLDLFKSLTGVDHAATADGPDTAVSDVLAHMMHYCRAKGINAIECFERGTAHFEDELIDEMRELADV